VQPENIEASPKANGTVSNPTAIVEPDESQTTISEHPVGETADDVSAWLEWHIQGQPEVAGTLS
jgi:hypothetical protein